MIAMANNEAMKMKIRHLFSATAIAEMATDAESAFPGGGSPKFYHGLEAIGPAELLPGGFKHKDTSVRIKWKMGMECE